ncbi:MAG: hypothetical protein O7H41_12465 [Planctomycetota bacterium]|nr:hypothetical protein [Planctomycetota bacterium]
MNRRCWILVGALLAAGSSSGCLSVIAPAVYLSSNQGGGSGGGGNAEASVTITTSFPAGVPVFESVTVDFLVSDQESNLVSILVEVSQDGGVTYFPATVAGPVVDLSSSPIGVAGMITWDSYADLGSTKLSNVRVRITPFDPKIGLPGATGSFSVDNTHLPDIYEVDNDPSAANLIASFVAAQVHSIHEPGDVDYVSIDVTSISQRYTIETSNLTGGDTILTLYDLDGTSILAGNDDKPGGGLASRVDFIFPSLGTYYAQIRDSTGGYLYTYDLSLMTVLPTAPSATVMTPTGPTSGGVTVSYTLVDPDANPASIIVEFSQNSGAFFSFASELPGPPSEGTTGLTTSVSGEPHQFVWDSIADIGATDQNDIQLRITPFDSATGTPSTTTSIRVDNIAPMLFSAEYTDNDFNGPEVGDTIELTFTEDIILGSPTLSAYVLPVAGDLFGGGASVSPGPGSDQMTIELGTAPVLIVAGGFNPASLIGGSPTGIDISLSLPPNAITDLAGNEATNYGDPALDDDGVDLDSSDTSAPSLVSASAQALSGLYNDEATVTFSEPVIQSDAEDLSNYIFDSPAGSPLDIGGAYAIYNRVTLTTTITLTDTGSQMDNLLYGGSFQVNANGVRDVAGNVLPAGSAISGTVGGDNIPPVLLTVNLNLLAGPGGDTVDFAFDEAMDPLTASDPVNYPASGGLTAISATLLSSFRQVRIVFSGPVTLGVTTADLANIRDLAGNVIVPVVARPIGGSDSVPPGMSDVTATAIEGLANDQARITFTEAVDVVGASTLANFTLESPIGFPQDITGSAIAHNSVTNTTTINLTNAGANADNLQFGASIRVTVDNVQDLTGNPITPGSFLDRIVTGDNVAPSVSSVIQDLVADATGASLDVIFNEAADVPSAASPGGYNASGGIGTLTATVLPDGSSVRVGLDSPVVSGSHTLSIAGVKDAAGNLMVDALGVIITSTDSTPPAATITDPADGGTVPENITVTGTANDAHSLITSVQVNGVGATTGDVFANWTASITLPTGTQSITVRTEDFNGNVNPSAASITVNVQGNTPPKATVTTPSGVLSGDVPVNYRLIDADNDPITITVEFSTDGGGSFFLTTESTDPLSEGTINLSSTPDPGIPHIYVWDSLADMGLTGSSQVRIRITPSDAVVGIPGVTQDFSVNNSKDLAPFIVGAVYQDGDGNGIDAGDRIVVAFNEPVRLNGADATAFVLPVFGDSFGSGATVGAGLSADEVLITLGAGPVLTTPGRYRSPVAGMPSGIDISPFMSSDAIEDAIGNDAVPTSSTLDSGTGADGAFDSTTYTSGNLPGITKVGLKVTVDTDNVTKQGAYDFTSFSLGASYTLVAFGSRPLEIRATGNVTVDGFIELFGADGGNSGSGIAAGPGGVPAAAGAPGGKGGEPSGANGLSGQGTGGATGGITSISQPGGGGGGASFATRGTAGSSGAGGSGGSSGATYGDAYLFPIRGGSGGGGGGGRRNQPNAGGGGGGGAGGGAIRISSGADVTIGGTIAAGGGSGGVTDITAAGGGGSGGSIHIQAMGDLTIGGAVLAQGGGAGAATGTGTSGGRGGNGRIRLEDSDALIPGVEGVDPSPSLGSTTADIGGGFHSSSPMLENRRAHAAVLLSNGTVLIGGGNIDLSGVPSSIAMIYDPINDTVISAGPMKKAFYERGVTLLPSGDVLFTGGTAATGNPSDQSEVYRAKTGAFESGAGMNESRAGHTVTVLPSGLVLVAGGGTNSAEIFDWVQDTFTLLPSLMTASRTGHSATLLGDARLLIAGGESGTSALITTEWFDIPTQMFVPGPIMNRARGYHSTALLPSGEVLIAGGEDGGIPLDSAEVYDPISDGFIPLAGTLSEPRTRLGPAARLPDGTFLLPGGSWRSADIFDPWTRTFVLVDKFLRAPRTEHTSTALPSGELLIIGGLDPTANVVTDSIERFTLEPRAGERTFQATGSPGITRSFPTAIRLPDGSVLVAGGNDGVESVSSAEIYEPVGGSFQPAFPMGREREGHAAVLLPTGEILVLGGLDDTPPGAGTLDTAELYDPISGTWTPTAGRMSEPRYRPQAILLWTGNVLVCGGQDSGNALASAEVYDVAGGTFVQVGDMLEAREGHAICRLPDGRVLLTGGTDDSPAVLFTAEIYDPITGVFSPTANMGSLRTGHTSNRLPNGFVLVAGGSTDGVNATATTELFNPGTETFSPGPNMASVRMAHTAALASNGTVLVAGGRTTTSGFDLWTAEVYSPPSNQFFSVGPMSAGRSDFPLVLLGDRRVLAVGSGPGAELYTP